MKLINKGTEPEVFANWKKDNPGLNYDSFSRTPVYMEVREALLKEQGYICCYCEKRIEGNGDCSIEHFMPRHPDPDNLSVDECRICTNAQLDYSNMLVSCESDTIIEERDHCNHKKSNWFDFKLWVSPTNPEILKLFEYSESGKINPQNNDERAVEMIRRLNLNSYILQEQRKVQYDMIVDCEFEDENLWNDQDYIKATMDFYYDLGEDGKYTPFCSMIRDCLKKYLLSDGTSR